MTTKRFKLLRDFVSLCSGQLLVKIVTFVAFAYLARTLEPEQYGFVEFAVALSLFFTMLVGMGLGAVGARELAKDPQQAPSFAATVPGLRFLLALIVVPLMGLSASLLKAGPETVKLVWLFALGLFAVPWKLDWIFQGLDMMKAVASGQVFRTLVFTIGVLVLVQGPDDLLRVGIAEIIAGVSAALFWVAFQYTRVTPVRLRFSPRELWSLLRKGSPIGLSNVVWALHQYFPVILVASLVGGEQTAWFGAAHRIVAALLVFSYVYYFNLFPAIVRRVRDSSDSFNDLIGASFRVVAWAGILVALVLSLSARPILVVVFGAPFGGAAPVFAVLVWAVPLTALGGQARWSLIAQGQERCVLFAQVAGAAVMLLAGPFLILKYEALGGSIATVTATLTVWLTAQAFVTFRVGHVPFLRHLARPAAVAVFTIVLSLTFEIPPWLVLTVLAAAVVSVPWSDPEFIPNFRHLAHGKSDVTSRDGR